MSDKPAPGGAPGHRARNVQPKGHDPYRVARKDSESMVCDMCGVVFHGGRWYWGQPPLGNDHGGLCPACQRIRDRYPAGTVRLDGLPGEHRDEVGAMVRHQEAAERDEHPLERVMDLVHHEDGHLEITTTGLHLARRIGEALERRFHGGVTTEYLPDAALVKVRWRG